MPERAPLRIGAERATLLWGLIPVAAVCTAPLVGTGSYGAAQAEGSALVVPESRSVRVRRPPSVTGQRLPSRMTRATSAGSSFIGQCPQPGSRTRRAWGMICLARMP